MLQASGKTIYTMFTQGTGAVLNILLDPLFIYGSEAMGLGFLNIPEMGAAGAAVATVIGQWVGAVMAVFFNLTKNDDVKFALKYLRPDSKVTTTSRIVAWSSLRRITAASSRLRMSAIATASRCRACVTSSSHGPTTTMVHA